MNPELFILVGFTTIMLSYPFFCLLSCANSTSIGQKSALPLLHAQAVNEFAVS